MVLTKVLNKCLDKEKSLRDQMMQSFMTLSLATLFSMLVICICITFGLGSMASSESTSAVDTQIKNNILLSCSESAAVIQKKFENLEATVLLQEQAVLDMMDQYAFKDTAEPAGYTSQPVVAGTSYQEWQNDVPGMGKSKWFQHEVSLTKSTVFWQGACDPSLSSGSMPSPSDGFFPGCTAASNTAPTAVQDQIQKSDVLDHFFAPIAEANPDIQAMGFWPYNAGAGAVRYYPGLSPIPFGCYYPIDCNAVDAANPLGTSWNTNCNGATDGGHSVFRPQWPLATEDISCDKMSGTFCTSKHPDLKCQDDPLQANYGKCVVCGRHYNAVERPWYASAVSASYYDADAFQGKMVQTGPFRYAWTDEGTNTWLLNFAKAVYARGGTHELIGVVNTYLEIQGLQNSVLEIKFLSSGGATLAKLDGTVVASQDWDSASSNEVVNIQDDALQNGIDATIWAELTNSDSGGSDRYAIAHCARTPRSALVLLLMLVCYLLLLILACRLWDIEPPGKKPRLLGRSFVPEGCGPTELPCLYLVLVYAEKWETHGTLDKMNDDISATNAFVSAITLGLVLVITLVITLLTRNMAHHITEPLQWMSEVGDSITRRAGEKDLMAQANQMKEKHEKNIHSIPEEERDEIEQLVGGFTEMITGYGSASAAQAVTTNAKFLVDPFQDSNQKQSSGSTSKLERFWE
jgi:hypothetical protein